MNGPTRTVARITLTASMVGAASLGVAQALPGPAAVAAVARPEASAPGAGGSGHADAAQAERTMRLRVWRWALKQRGKPYIWGATGPAGFDCSGLVFAAYRSRGIHLPRTTYQMLASWHLVRIPKSQARRGDLAFFGSGHVELFDHGNWTFGAATSGTRIGYHRMNQWWHPTMYFRVRRHR
jgi:cell wall-associated NlpC family hydrolase